MTTLVLLAATLLAADPVPSAAETLEPRRFHEIERDLVAALKAEATAESLEERADAVRKLCAIYREVNDDPRLLTSVGLQDFRSRARGRLANVQRRLERKIALAAQAERAKARRGEATAPVQVSQADEAQLALAREVTAQVTLASYSLGGPSQIFEAAGGAFGGGAINDHGQELVELIQRTIAPQKWDVNGGPCTIVYYRPLMCLVVTATGDVHDGVGGVLGGLRAAGP